MDVAGSDRYTPDKLPQFEADVDAQATNRAPYSLDVNVAVLRLYQLQPSVAKADKIAKIFLKSLMQLPAPDYKICSHVLPEKLQSEEPVATIALLASHLDTFRLNDFWTLAGSCKDVLGSVPSFLDAVRGYILSTFGAGCQRLRLGTLVEALQLSEGEVRTLVARKEKEAGWVLSGDLVVLPREAAAAAPRVIKDTISFEAVAPAMRGLAVH